MKRGTFLKSLPALVSLRWAFEWEKEVPPNEVTINFTGLNVVDVDHSNEEYYVSIDIESPHYGWAWEEMYNRTKFITRPS